MDRVDTIMAPAMVIPVSTNPEDYVQVDREKHQDLYFYCVPYEILCRDDWHDINRQGLAADADGIDTEIYERSTLSKRRSMMQVLYPRNVANEDELEESDPEENGDSDTDSDTETEKDDDEDEDNEDKVNKKQSPALKIIQKDRTMPKRNK